MISQDPLKPSGWWYGVAAAVAVVSIVIAVVVFVNTITGLIDRVDDFQRISLPGSGTVTLEDTGGYTVYHEFPGASGGTGFGSFISVEVLAPDGSTVALDRYDADVSYSWGDHEGVAVYSFRADQPGEYTVQGEGERGELAVGRGIGSGLASGIVGSLLIGLGGSIVAAIIAIVVGVKRGRDRRSRMTYGPQYPPGPPGPPGSGWARAEWPGAVQPAPGGYAPPQPPPGQYPPGNMQPPPGLPPT